MGHILLLWEHSSWSHSGTDHQHETTIPVIAGDLAMGLLHGLSACGGPFQDGVEDWTEGLAPWGQGILDFRWDYGIDGAVDDAVLFELAELLGQHFLGDGRDGPFQFGKPSDLAAEELEEDQKLPAAFEHAKSLVHSFGRRDGGPGRGFILGRGTYFFVGSCHFVSW